MVRGIRGCIQEQTQCRAGLEGTLSKPSTLITDSITSSDSSVRCLCAHGVAKLQHPQHCYEKSQPYSDSKLPSVAYVSKISLKLPGLSYPQKFLAEYISGIFATK